MSSLRPESYQVGGILSPRFPVLKVQTNPIEEAAGVILGTFVLCTLIAFAYELILSWMGR